MENIETVGSWDYETYPKCSGCGSHRLAHYRELITNPPPDSEDIEKQIGRPLIWGSDNALEHLAYVCLDCGRRTDDLRDFHTDSESILQ